ncbi:MAG: phosphoenolpyruvate kinase [Bacteroidetes bacterium]|nr:phosphoenolpyruvate kinase [Bacteroidota bacterium]MCW5895162.1 phosphoenolpyruvate kinase [Bacteroidota bacterium]
MQSHEQRLIEADDILSNLREANYAFAARYPGDTGLRQPVHTVYGGAQIFKSDTAKKLGEVGLRAFLENAPDFVAFARAIQLPGFESFPKSARHIAALTGMLKRNSAMAKTQRRAAWLAFTIYNRIIEKLKSEPVEDFRIDFEDGYGNRLDNEEDSHAAFTAKEVARGMRERTLPPFIGIRIKPMTEELKARSLRTTNIFVTTLLAETGGILPAHFVITIPKVTIPQHVTAVVELCNILERTTGLDSGSLRLELMIETPQSIFNANGESHIPLLALAGKGRIVGMHFGVYDYTALCEITAAHQSMRHPACDFARHIMKVALAQTGINISDGATNIMPVGPHRAAKGKKLSARQLAENNAAVHRAWKHAFDDTMHSLKHGFYQGWDLHPAQLCVRYAAVYAFFLEGLDLATLRLRSFMEKAAQATLIGDVFDDAATGQGLLNYFLRGMSCRAITEEEASATGLTLEELRSRSFLRILDGRRTA